MKASDLWFTPQWLFDHYSAKYGPFNLDVCATHENAKCKNYFTLELSEDGLEIPWYENNGRKCWMNPPYSDPYPWLKKASEEAKKGCTVYALLNYDHTTAWWKDFIENSNDDYKPYPGVTIDKYPKRVKFGAPQWFLDQGGKVTTNTKPTVLVIFRPVTK